MQMKVAEEQDFAEIVELANWSYRGAEKPVQSWNFEGGLIQGQRMDLGLLREELEAKAGGGLLIFREAAEGPLLGTAWVHPAEGTAWHLGLLTVRPDRQAEGLGRQFLGAAERYIEEHGGHRVRISVLHLRDELIAWYERRGFRQTGETEPFPYGDSRFGLPLRDDLWFVIMEKDV